MGSFLSVDLLSVDYPHLGLVDQSCRLQRVSRPLSRHVMTRNPAQIQVNDGNKLVQCSRVPMPPVQKKLRHRMSRRRCHPVPLSITYPLSFDGLSTTREASPRNFWNALIVF